MFSNFDSLNTTGWREKLPNLDSLNKTAWNVINSASNKTGGYISSADADWWGLKWYHILLIVIIVLITSPIIFCIIKGICSIILSVINGIWDLIVCLFRGLWNIVTCPCRVCLNCCGFTSKGVRGDSYASHWQSGIGNVSSGSTFSRFQSTGATYNNY